MGENEPQMEEVERGTGKGQEAKETPLHISWN